MNLNSEVLKKPAKIAIQLISRYKDEAEEIVMRASLSAGVKQVLLNAVKHRRIQLYNLRGY